MAHGTHPNTLIPIMAHGSLPGTGATTGVGETAVNSNVVRTAVGRYTINFTPPLPTTTYTVMLTAEETAARDSIDILYLNRTNGSVQVQIHEGDNGTAANAFRDRGFAWMVVI